VGQKFHIYMGPICSSYGVSSKSVRGGMVLVVCQLSNSATSSCCHKCTEKSICPNGIDRNSFNFFFYDDESEILLDLCLIHVEPQRNC